MNIPQRLKSILDAIVAAGGRPMLVGGCVRDHVMGLDPKDHDVEIYGMRVSELIPVLENFGKVNAVGVSFGVLKVGDYDFTLPRTENKRGAKHGDFDISINPNLDPKLAAARRDFTINSMYYDYSQGVIVDPYDGRRDIYNKVLRPTSIAFQEDALRVLRGMQFAGRFNMMAVPELSGMAVHMFTEYQHLAKERVYGEWEKWALKSKRPAAGLKLLVDTGWILLYPELNALVGLAQDAIWHPEGDAWVHTGHVCNAMAELCDNDNIDGNDRVVLMLAALCHDLGKAVTTVTVDGRIRSPGHAEAGVEIAASFLNSIGVPPGIVLRVLPLVQEHMVHVSSDITPRTVRRLAIRLHPSNISELMYVIRADMYGRPPLPRELGEHGEKLERIGKEVKVELNKPKPIVMGRHLLEKGWVAGPEMGKMLKELYDLQLDGEFSSVEDGISLALYMGGE